MLPLSTTLISHEVRVECCYTFTDTVGLLGTGAQDGHLDFHKAPELCPSISSSSTFHIFRAGEGRGFSPLHNLGSAKAETVGTGIPPGHPGYLGVSGSLLGVSLRAGVLGYY